MKKLIILILLSIFLVCGLTNADEKSSGIPTEEQVQKLVAAVWKEPIRSIDVTFYKDFTGIPLPIEKIRKEVEKTADQEFKGRLLDKLEPYEIERRNKNIEINLKNWVENQKFPRKMKEHVWISDDKQRTDFVKVGPNESLSIDTPFVHTFINTKDPNTKDFVSYHYAGDMNTAIISTTKKWEKKDIIQFAGMPVAGALQAFLGIDRGGSTLTSPNYIPDPNKMAELARTGLASIESIAGVKMEKPGANRIRIYPDPNALRSRDIIEMGDPNYFPTAVLICDREDYSRVYHTEFHIPTTNKLIYFRECSDFDSNGFPHNITEIKYGIDGNFVEKSVYRVIKVEPNPSIPASVFEFNPPEDYKIVKTDANGINRTIRESRLERGMRLVKEAKNAKNVATLKELLGYEMWQVRLSALQELETLLTQDKQGLRDAATILKDDEKLEVRKEAQRILGI